ncbi:MAG TPA: hypothetical protein PKX56_09520 [Marmoricola sp.]|nr:hypothetical protein [Marmoricola sp.]HNI70182.1 hypothetical protein [Marmoricola sp.]HNJ79584.1 hypothetical protein [Marmoricola sp.]HNN49012.1 hypothetical protein [Marmoricola sp.]
MPKFRITHAALVAALTGLLLVGIIPAGQARVRYAADTRGDTMTYDVGRGIWQATPTNKDGDLLGVRVSNARKAVVVTLTFAKLVPSAPTVRSAQYTVNVATPGGGTLSTMADYAQAPSNPVTTSGAGGQVVCSPKATWIFGDNKLRLRFPNHCFTNRSRVWVSASSRILTDRHDGEFHRMISDTAYSRGGVSRR